MAFPASAMSRQFFGDLLAGTLGTASVPAWKSGGNAFFGALYDNTVSATKDDASAAYAYGGTSWATGGAGTGSPQVFQAVQWPQAGVQLATGGTVITSTGGGFVSGGASNLASGTACTLSNAYGVFIYNNSFTTPVSKQGICHNLFGGSAQSVTNGTFTVIFSANGVWRIAC